MTIDAFISSASLVTIAEIGDKTQLLSLVLAARYRRAMPIIFGILLATTLNHALAAWLGELVGNALEGGLLQWVVPVSFIVIGLWVLIPDKLDEEEKLVGGKWGAFTAASIMFFLAEMGDKTQIATVVLGARYHDLVTVVAGTTLGMLIANIPAVLMGDKLLRRIPLDAVRYVASALFILFGVIGLSPLFHQ